MDIRQRLSDLLLSLKEDRKTQVVAIFGILILCFLCFSEKPRRHAQEIQEDIIIETGSPSDEKKSGELMQAFTNRIDATEKNNKEHQKQLKVLQEQIEANEAKTAKIMERIIEKLSDLETAQVSAKGSAEDPITVESEVVEPKEDEDNLQAWGDVNEEDPVAIPKDTKPNRLAVIGAADSVRVRLLTGVHARTDGVPYPVVLECIDDVIGPDGSALPLGNARLIAAAQGSLTDQRALFRLSSLDINMPNGSRKIVSVDGWVVGEDGLAGMEGILIDPIGKVIAGSIFSGTLDGLGEGMADSQIKQNESWYGVSKVVEGDQWKYALGKGIEKGADKWSEFIEKRSDALIPHVRVLSGRTATAIFSKSVTIDGVYEALTDGDEASLVSLD